MQFTSDGPGLGHENEIEGGGCRDQPSKRRGEDSAQRPAKVRVIPQRAENNSIGLPSGSSTNTC